MRTAVYRPGKGGSSLGAGVKGPDLSSLVEEVGATSPALAEMASAAADGLDEGSVARERVKQVLADFERGELTLSSARSMLHDVYRQNLPEEVPVDAAVEGPCTL